MIVCAYVRMGNVFMFELWIKIEEERDSARQQKNVDNDTFEGEIKKETNSETTTDSEMDDHDKIVLAFETRTMEEEKVLEEKEIKAVRSNKLNKEKEQEHTSLFDTSNRQEDDEDSKDRLRIEKSQRFFSENKENKRGEKIK